MADEKDKAKDKNKQEKLKEKAEETGGTFVNSGGNAGAGKSGGIILGGTEPHVDEKPNDEKENG